MLITWLSNLCLLLGVFFCFTSALGILRLPDFYARLHAVGIADILGAGLILFGLILQAGFTLLSLKLAGLLGLLLLTSPTTSNALAETALQADSSPLQNSQAKPSSKH